MSSTKRSTRSRSLAFIVGTPSLRLPVDGGAEAVASVAAKRVADDLGKVGLDMRLGQKHHAAFEAAVAQQRVLRIARHEDDARVGPGLLDLLGERPAVQPPRH